MISNGGGVKQYVQLMGRGLVGVRASDGKFLWGYNKVANDVANISTPIVQGDYVFASTGYQTGAALLKLEPRPGTASRPRRSTSSTAKIFQNHHGGFVLVGDHIYGGHGHNKGFPICLELATGKVVWGGDIRNAGTGSAAVVVRRRQPLLPLPERRRDPDRGDARRATRRRARSRSRTSSSRAGRTPWSPAAGCTCASRTTLYVYDVKA